METKNEKGMYSAKNMELFNFLKNRAVVPNLDLCDFSEMKTKGIITIEAVKKKNGVKTKEIFRSFTVPATGITYGIPTSIDKEGFFTFRRIVIEDGRNYDLSNRADALEYFLIQNWFKTMGSKYENKAISNWKIVDIEHESEMFIREEERKQTMRETIMSMNDAEISDFARVLGYDPDVNSMIVIRRQVVERSYTDDKTIKMLLQDKRKLEILKIFKRALATRIILQEASGGYKYNGVNLGYNDDEVANNMGKKEFMETLAIIDRSSKENDKTLSRIASAVSSSKPVDNIKLVGLEMEAKDNINKAIDAEIIKQNGAFYFMADINIGQGKKVLYEKYVKEEDFKNKIREALEKIDSGEEF